MQELNEKMGVKCVLKEDAVPRAYYPAGQQQGMGKAPFVLELTNSRYDIGFYPDGNGGYEARTDFWNGYVQKEVGVQACSTASVEQAKMGKLFQAYGVAVSIEQARKQGYNVRRVEGKDGAVQLLVSGM